MLAHYNTVAFKLFTKSTSVFLIVVCADIRKFLKTTEITTEIDARYGSFICSASLIILCESFRNTNRSFGCSPFVSLRRFSLAGKLSFVLNGCGWVLNQRHLSLDHVTHRDIAPFSSGFCFSSHTYLELFHNPTSFVRECCLPVISMITLMNELLLIPAVRRDRPSLKFLTPHWVEWLITKYLERGVHNARLYKHKNLGDSSAFTKRRLYGLKS